MKQATIPKEQTDPDVETPLDGEPTAKRKWARRGMMKPGRWEVRMMISLPATMIFLLIFMGLSSYFIMLHMTNTFAQQRESLTPYLQTAEALNIVNEMRLTANDGERGILIVLLVFSFLGLLTGVGLVTSIILPLRQVTDAAATIARGKKHKTIQIRAGFELGQLSKSFNSMVDFINSMVERREAYLNEDIPSASLIIDIQGHITSLSPLGSEILGVDQENLIGKTLKAIREEQPQLASGFLEFCSSVLASLNTAINNSDEDAAMLSHTLPDKPIEIELEKPAKDPITLSVGCSLMRDDANAPHAVAFLFRDASHLKNLHELFSHTDQLAALGTFTIGLSHELRNPLGALKGTTQLLDEKIGQRPDCRPYLDRIIREVDRLDLLVHELYDFSSSPPVSEEPCDLNEMTRGTLLRTVQGMDAEVKRDKQLVEKYAVGLPSVVVQSSRVARAIGNVIINAFEHMEPGSILTVRTHRLDESSTSPVVLEIANTGSMIEKEDLEKIFEPFFSTRQSGTGLGLAIAYQIIVQNHGQLSAFSEENEVKFRFVFRKVSPAEKQE